MAEASKDTFYGIPIKPMVLFLLTIQNSTVILTMRYSRTLPGPKYISSTAVVLSELIKLVISFLVCNYIRQKQRNDKSLLPETAIFATPETTSRTQVVLDIVRDTFSKKNGFFLLMIPAVLYTIQNNLIFVAASNLDAATFQVTYQGKLLTTAVFAVVILRQKLTALRWAAVFTLTVGVATISYPSEAQQKAAEEAKHEGSRNFGLIAVAAACLISGFAGVYIELMMKAVKDAPGKNGNSMIWIRNTQLSFSAFVISIVGCIIWDWSVLKEHGVFYGYNSVVWTVIWLQAAGGIIVSLVITYADNILKSFATSLSVIISTVVSVARQDTIVTKNLIVGVLLVLGATQMYSLPVSSATPSTTVPDPTNASEEEKHNLLNSPESSSASSSSAHDEDSSDDENVWEDQTTGRPEGLNLKKINVV